MEKRKSYKRKTFGSSSNKFCDKKSEQKQIEELTQKLKELEEKEAHLDKEIKELRDKGVSVGLKATIIKTLHEYNEMKDSTQIILGYLANIQTTTVGELHKKYNLPME